MKVSAKGNSRFLSQEDVPEPFTANIQELRLEKLKSNRGEEEKYVLYFVTGKPMVFNVVNRKTVIAAYGDDSDTWIGKPIEVYVNPDVYMGSERTGGIRVRIPTGSHHGAAPALKAAPVIAPKPKAPPASQRTAADDVAQAIDGMNHSREVKNLNEWARWGKAIGGTTQEQKDLLEDAFHVNMDRITTAAPVRPVFPTPPTTTAKRSRVAGGSRINYARDSSRQRLGGILMPFRNFSALITARESPSPLSTGPATLLSR